MADREGYHVVDPEQVPETPDYHCKRRSISDAAELDVLAVAEYDIEPGEQLPRTYHYHDLREELFLVRAGRLWVETPDEGYTVDVGEFFAVEPGHAHRAYNPDDAEETVRVLGVGAPASDVARPYERS